jgi:hypothetical protein
MTSVDGLVLQSINDSRVLSGLGCLLRMPRARGSGDGEALTFDSDPMLMGVHLRILLCSVDRRTVRGSILRDQHHAEPGFALHHASVILGRFIREIQSPQEALRCYKLLNN